MVDLKVSAKRYGGEDNFKTYQICNQDRRD